MKNKAKLFFFLPFTVLYTVMFLTHRITHEIFGVLFILLLAVHLFLNSAWFTMLRKGTYTTKRKVMFLCNALFLLCMVGALITGLMFSRSLFPALPIHMTGKSFKIIHETLAYGTVAFLVMHTVLHIKVVGHYVSTLISKMKLS